ncbi:MAG: 50S ribosomal protein L11 methyltransferase [Candidatus Pelethousia sp.]|nr:50S ribosomal protein L11 methyltransferase [Candidatus Pelethousia sp.]
MKWTEITVFTTEEGLDAVCGRLSTLGIDQVQIEQGRDSIAQFLRDTAKYWDYADLDALVTGEEPCVRAYLANVSDNGALVDSILASFDELRHMDVGLDLGSLRMVVRLTDEEDWANNWKVYYKPLPIGERLLVCPSWEHIDSQGRVLLSLDPGMAFGTGGHHTTRMCLEYLEQRVQDGDVVLDLGCGSGILSIASLLLGAAHATGVDIDPLAEKIAAENAALNGIGPDRYTVLAGDVLSDSALTAKLAQKEYDVITANIVADVIIGLCPMIPSLLKAGGCFVMSGIIAERLNDVLDALSRNGLKPLDIRQGEDWRAILAERA